MVLILTNFQRTSVTVKCCIKNNFGFCQKFNRMGSASVLCKFEIYRLAFLLLKSLLIFFLCADRKPYVDQQESTENSFSYSEDDRIHLYSDSYDVTSPSGDYCSRFHSYFEKFRTLE